MCRLRLTEPAKASAIEHRLAIKDHIMKVAVDFGISRSALTHHWKNHCDAAAILREVHRQDRDAAMSDLLARAEVENIGPMVVTDRQIALYIEDFNSCNARLRAAANADEQRRWREAREAADRRLFVWTHFKFRQLIPITETYGPRVAVQNNMIVAGAGADFGQLVAQMEQRLALRRPDERRQFIALLREVAASDAAPLEMLPDAAD
jgi:hypothetical protein